VSLKENLMSENPNVALDVRALHTVNEPKPPQNQAPRPPTDGLTWEKSVRLEDPGATAADPHRPRAFINPDPRSRMLGSEWEAKSGCRREEV
jgi:hypothetical protein